MWRVDVWDRGLNEGVRCCCGREEDSGEVDSSVNETNSNKTENSFTFLAMLIQSTNQRCKSRK